MSLTAKDMNQIKQAFSEIIEPNMTKLNREFGYRYSELKLEVNEVALATNRKLHTVFTDIEVLRQDVRMLRDEIDGARPKSRD